MADLERDSQTVLPKVKGIKTRQLTLLGAIGAHLQCLLHPGSQCLCNQQPCGVSPPLLLWVFPHVLSCLCLCLCLTLLLVLLHLQLGGLTSTHNVSDHLAIHPLFTLSKNTSAIHAESLDSPLVPHRVIKLVFLRILRKGEFGL